MVLPGREGSGGILAAGEPVRTAAVLRSTRTAGCLQSRPDLGRGSTTGAECDMVRALRYLAILGWAVTLMPGAVHGASRGHRARSVFCPVLIYHHVKWLKPSDDAIERGLTILPTQFAAELNYLANHHYHPVSVATLAHALQTGAKLPSRP